MINQIYWCIEDFVYDTKAGKWITITKLIVWAWAIWLFLDPALVKSIWNYWYIDFGTLYITLLFLSFASDIVVWISGYCNKKEQPIENNTEYEYEIIPTIKEDKITIDWIPTEDLILHIIEHKWLPTIETKQKFNINNDSLKKIWDNLERVGILKRWPNNARVLATDDIDDLVDTMRDIADSDMLKTKHKIIQVSESQILFK